MTDKKAFGAYIKTKRAEKNYSQKDLAEMLYVTESAVSKWERGVSYPDISLISDICNVLEISEHELITASNDTDTRKIKHEARKFRVIRSMWFWIPTIAYAVALLVCFICNLAVDHTLSWFFVVLTALLCAYTFVPTVTGFFESKKLLWFAISTFLSICLLLFTCAVYTDGLSWFATACIGVFMGYELLFVPILLAKSNLSRYRYVISFALGCVLTILLLLNIHIWHPLSLAPAIWITCYAFVPVICCAVICTLRFNGFLKAGICTTFSTVVYYFTNCVVDLLFGTQESAYQIDFRDWSRCLKGNVHIVVLVSLLLIGAVFVGIGVFRTYKQQKR